MGNAQYSDGPVPVAYVIDQMDAGGTERQLIELVSGLDRNRFEPYLMMLRNRNFWGDVGCTNTVFAINQKVMSLRGAVQILRMARTFRRKRIRIVQTFFADAAFMGVVAARLARVPLIITSRRDMGFWYTPFLVKNLRRLHALSGHVLANSESVRQNVGAKEGIPLEDIDVIYNGLQPALFECSDNAGLIKKEFGVDSDSAVVGIVSTLDRDVKRVDLFLQAVPHIAKQWPAARFVIVGDGHLRDGLEQQSRDLGVSDKVVFAGSRKDVYRLLGGFDVGINCSDSEGFSNSVIEYMMAGVPAVASDVGGNAELIEEGETGLLFPPGDARSLAECVVRLLEDSAMASSIRRNARNKALANFTTETMVRNHMEYYDRLLDSAGAGCRQAGNTDRTSTHMTATL